MLVITSIVETTLIHMEPIMNAEPAVVSSPAPRHAGTAKPRMKVTMLVLSLLLGGLGLGLFIGVLVLVLAPQVVRVPFLQPPISATARAGYLSPFVLQLRNDSDRLLTDVHIICSNWRRNQSQQITIGTLAPRAVTELGALEWDWPLGGGDTITISAGGYGPIIFTAGQLGLE